MPDDGKVQSSFAEIAVSLFEAMRDARLDAENAEKLFIRLPEGPGINRAMAAIWQRYERIDEAHQIFKMLCEFEPEFRALIDKMTEPGARMRAGVFLLAGAAA